MERSRIPNKLQSYRRSQGYSQKKVARMLGLADTSTLSRWETGVVIPSLVHVFRLARMYNALPHELYDDLWQTLEKESSLLAHCDEPFISNQPLYV